MSELRDLKERTTDYALRVVRLYDALPRRGSATVLGKQLLRSGTSAGAHYREAIRGRSTAEYVAKLNAGLMELEETLYWLELLDRTGIVSHRRLNSLEDETSQLCAIFVSLIKKTKR